MKGFRNKKSAFIILLCTLMVIFAFSVSAKDSSRWVDEETMGTFPKVHEHIYGEWTIPEGKEPTCSSTGVRVKKCLFTDGTDYCDKEYIEELPVDPDAHVRGNDVNIVTQATCNRIGESEFKCAAEGCGATIKVYTETKPHTFEGEWTETAPIHEPSFEWPGKRINRCSECLTYVEEDIPVVHEYEGEGTVTQAATCTTKGTRLIYCKVCKKSKTIDIEIDPENHVYSGKAIPVGTVDCINGGKGITQCEECDKTVYVNIPAEKAHDYLEWIIVEPTGDCKTGTEGYVTKVCPEATCTEKFEVKKYYAHQLTEDVRIHLPTCSKYGYMKGSCTVCKAVDVEVVLPVDESAHSWIEQVLVEPTCTTKGYVFRICKYDSSHTEYIEIPKAEHTFVEDWKVSKVATCTQKGEKTNVCVLCREQITKETDYDLDYHPSVNSWYVIKYASCTETGLESAYCVDCEAKYGSGKGNITREIPKHTGMYELISTTEANCRNPGEKVYECKGCGFKRTEIIPVNIGVHYPGFSYYVTKVATCSEVGKKSKLCNYCMEPIVAEVGEHRQIDIPKTSHVMTDWTMVTQPTCTEPGVKSRTCITCGSVQETTVAASHRYESWRVDDSYQQATCTTNGRRVRGCYNCDVVETEYYTLPHEAGKWYFKSGNCTNGGIIRRDCTICGLVANEKTVKAGEHVDLVEGDIKYAVSDSVCSSLTYTCSVCSTKIESITRHSLTSYTNLASYADLHDFCDDENCKKEHKAVGSRNCHVVCTQEGCTKYHKPSAESCENNGWTEQYYCMLCKYVIKQSYIPAYGHNFEYDEEGTKYCLNCKLYYVQDYEPCDHFCHNRGTVAKVMTKVFTFFWKILDKFSIVPKYQYCECGMPHYELGE